MDHSGTESILLNSSFDTDNAELNKKKIIKLHRQFAHPPAERLKKLLSNSGIQSNSVFKIVDDIS